jgi:hypothetical protein
MFEAEPTPAEQIEQLEAQIDELREAIRRSRRLVVAGRACAFAGAALLICKAADRHRQGWVRRWGASR